MATYLRECHQPVNKLSLQFYVAVNFPVQSQIDIFDLTKRKFSKLSMGVEQKKLITIRSIGEL